MQEKTIADMDPPPPAASTEEALRRENEELRAVNRELLETIDAIRRGEVDAIVVAKDDQPHVYSLEGAEHPYRVLVERMHEGALTLTGSGIILYANSAFARMLNRPLSEVLGMPLEDLIAPRDRERFSALLEEARTAACRAELSACTGAGTIPVAFSMTPSDDAAVGSIGVVVADRRRDYDRLLLQSRMLDSVVDAVTAVDTDGTIVYWNEAAERLYGWSADERIGRPVGGTFDPVIPEEDAWGFLERLMAGEVWSGEYLARHRDGRRFPVQATQAPVYDDDGNLVAVIGTSHDISERKRADTALRESEERFRAAFENTPLGMIFGRADGTILNANPAAAQMFGYGSDELSGKSFAEITHPDDLLLELPLVEEVVAGRRDAYEVEKRYLRKDGGIIRVRMIGAAIRDADGTATEAIAIIEDVTERRRIETALRESETRQKVTGAIAAERQRLFDVLEALPVMICLLTLDRHVSFANRKYREMFGATEGRHCYEMNFGFAEPCPFCEAYSVLETGEPHQWECVTPAGRIIEVFNAPFTDADGTPLVLEMDVDVTDQREAAAALREANVALDERVRERTADLEDANARLRDEIDVRQKAEAALRESEGLYRRLFETMHQGVVYQDAGGRIVSMNPAAERILGKGPAEFLGSSSVDQEYHTLREDGAPFPGLEHPAMVALRTGEEIRDVVMGVYNPRERGYRWISITAVPLFEPGGAAPYQVYTLFADITARKRAEEALRRSEQRYRSLVEYAPDAIFVNRDDRLAYLNPAGLRLFGAAALEDVTGRPVLDLFAPAYREFVTSRIRELRAGSPVPLVDEQILRLDGTVRDVEVGAFPFEDEAGPAIEVILRDVTDRKEAERHTAEYAARLKASNEELQRFAYVASHDLQEPLRSIVSFSQLLERRYKGALGQDADDYIGFIVEGGIRMQRLINDLLQVSRIETQAKPFEPIDAGRIARDAVALLNGRLQEAGATVTIGELPAVMADAAQLEQVFVNLISNAIKYRREDVPPAIRITAHASNPTVEFAVQDNGIGIEAEYFDRIFEMFRRLHTHDQYEGTGIGLAVVKRIVERHGGTIRVESTPGEGSTFFFTLPVA